MKEVEFWWFHYGAIVDCSHVYPSPQLLPEQTRSWCMKEGRNERERADTEAKEE